MKLNWMIFVLLIWPVLNGRGGIVLVAALPKNSYGKILKRQLRERDSLIESGQSRCLRVG